MPKVEKINDSNGKHSGYLAFCPGCNTHHVLYTENVPGMPNWNFNGDVDNPTFSPSLLVWNDYGPKEKHFRCHSFIRNGVWQFLNDCTHALAGQHVPVPEVTEED